MLNIFNFVYTPQNLLGRTRLGLASKLICSTIQPSAYTNKKLNPTTKELKLETKITKPNFHKKKKILRLTKR